MLDEPSENHFVVRYEPSAVEQVLSDQDEETETEGADGEGDNEHPNRRADVRTQLRALRARCGDCASVPSCLLGALQPTHEAHINTAPRPGDLGRPKGTCYRR